MEITQEQYSKIAPYLPRQRGNVSMSNLNLVNAILYIVENGSKWRALPKSYGNWHSIYVRMNRWSKNGILSRLLVSSFDRSALMFSMTPGNVHDAKADRGA